ncbi:MAG: DedA family protein [Parcubacteria group bacterium]|nr:DedA family protein [Parcubacteria group bacterium]
MFQSLQTWFIDFILGPGGYPALFFYHLLVDTLVPGSPEAAAVAVWAAGLPVVASIAVMSAGNFAGNVLNYWIGHHGTRLVRKYFHIKQERLARAERWFDKFGGAVLLFSWLPVVGDTITFVPGIVRYSFAKFTVYVLAGKVIRYIGLYYLVRAVV